MQQQFMFLLVFSFRRMPICGAHHCIWLPLPVLNSLLTLLLAPMEAAKVRIQTQPGYANTLRDAAPKMYKEEGLKASKHFLPKYV